jgi:hypothetical protein
VGKALAVYLLIQAAGRGLAKALIKKVKVS